MGEKKEGLDLLGAWDWLIKEKGVPADRIGLYGVSLGGAAVLSAMSQEPRVAAGFEDSSFAEIHRTVTDRMKEFGVPLFLADLTLTIGHWITGDDISAYPIIDAIENLDQQPVFIVHSEDDPDISIGQSYLIQETLENAGQPVETWYVSGSIHARVILDYPEEYEQRMVAFFNAQLGHDGGN